MELARFLSSRVVRVGVTGLVLAALAASVDVRETFAAFIGADVHWLLLAILTILLIRVVMALRWWQILSAYGFSVGVWKVTKLIFITSSLGSVLPSGIGQDLLRGYHLVRAEGRVSEVSASILVDRALGIFSMALVAGVAGLLAMQSLEGTPLRLAVLAALAIVVGSGALYLFRRRIRSWFRFEGSRLPEKLAQRLGELSTSVFDGSVDSGVIVSILLLSVIVQLARTVVFMLVFTALGVSTDSLHYFVAIPVVFLLLQVPISVGGLGVREVALVVFLRDAGLTPEVSVAGGLVFQCLQLVAYLPGLGLFLFSREGRESRASG